MLAPSRAQYFNYTLNQNGTLRQYTSAEEDYSTDVFTKKAKRWIRANARASTPFYLELGYAAPHGGGGGDPGRSCNRAAVPAPRDLGTLKGKFRNTLPPSFNEADVTDKPSTVAEKTLLTEGQVSDTLRKRRCAWESLLGVDDSVGELLAEIRARRDPQEHLRLLSLRQRLPARRAPNPRQQALPLRGVGAGPVHRPRPGDPARPELRGHGRQRRPDLDRAGPRQRQPRARAGRPVADAEPARPEARARAGDPARGLRRRTDPRRADLALPLHGVGRRQEPAAARARALRHVRRPESAQQPRRRPGLSAGRQPARQRSSTS